MRQTGSGSDFLKEKRIWIRNPGTGNTAETKDTEASNEEVDDEFNQELEEEIASPRRSSTWKTEFEANLEVVVEL